MPDVEIVVQDRTFTAYLAVPPGSGTMAGSGGASRRVGTDA